MTSSRPLPAIAIHGGAGVISRASVPAEREAEYLVALREIVAAGRLTPQDAMRRMPKLKRVGGMCPCSKAVRWVVEEPASTPATNGH